MDHPPRRDRFRLSRPDHSAVGRRPARGSFSGRASPDAGLSMGIRFSNCGIGVVCAKSARAIPRPRAPCSPDATPIAPPPPAPARGKLAPRDENRCAAGRALLDVWMNGSSFRGLDSPDTPPGPGKGLANCELRIVSFARVPLQLRRGLSLRPNQSRTRRGGLPHPAGAPRSDPPSTRTRKASPVTAR